jgi:hypothetical protein
VRIEYATLRCNLLGLNKKVGVQIKKVGVQIKKVGVQNIEPLPF